MQTRNDTIPLTDDTTPKKKLPGWVILPILAAILLIFFLLSQFFGAKGTDISGGTELAAVTAERGNVAQLYNSSGIIESQTVKTYYSPVTAPISTYKAAVGQTVKSGDLLVSFDTTNLERDNQQAQLTLQSSLNASRTAKAQDEKARAAAAAAQAQTEEQLAALEKEVRSLEAKVNAAKTQYDANIKTAGTQAKQNQTRREELDKTIQQNKQIITASQAVIDSTETGYAGKRADLQAALNVPEADRTDEQKKIISDLQPVFDAYDKAVTDRNNAEAAMEQAQAERDRLKDPEIDDAGYAQLKSAYDAKYAEWLAALQAAQTPAGSAGMTKEELAGLAISDNLAELAALSPEELLQKGRDGIRADMDGVIASANAAQTGTATQGMVLFTIADTKNVCVKIEVSPDDYGKMKIGTSADITVGDYTYHGTLESVDRIAVQNAKGTPVIGARIRISDPDENICIGSSAKVKMTLAESKDVIIIPTQALNASADGDFVYVIENGIVQERLVELGTFSATHAEITSGLSEGDVVVNDLSNLDIEPGMQAVANIKASS